MVRTLVPRFLFLPHSDVICDLLLNRRKVIWDLFVEWIAIILTNQIAAAVTSTCFSLSVYFSGLVCCCYCYWQIFSGSFVVVLAEEFVEYPAYGTLEYNNN